MSNENTIDYNQAMEQLHKTTDELRKISRNKHQVMPVSPYCSFCSKGKNEVKKMLKGPNVHICIDG